MSSNSKVERTLSVPWCAIMAQKASDTDFRRKWDADEFADRARKRKLEEEANAPKKSNEPVKRELLKQRDFKVDLDGHVGKIQVVTKACSPAEKNACAIRLSQDRARLRRAALHFYLFYYDLPDD